MKKDVLFITRKWPPAVGGMETYCIELINALKPLVNLYEEKLPGRANGAPPSIFSILLFGISTTFKVLLSNRRYDVIHGGDMAIWPLVWIAATRSANARTILSAHGTDVALASKQGLTAFIYRQYLHLGATLLKNSRVIANSRATAALVRIHKFQNVDIVLLGTECPLDAPTNHPPENYILFVGRLVHRKGFRWFAENVMPLLPENISLKVAGTITDKSEEAAITCPRVEFLGPVFDQPLRQLRQKALVVIVPNIGETVEDFEGFGLTVLEAAAAGGIVMASDIHGISDAVVDGVTGHLMSAGDEKAWVEKILEIQSMDARDRQSFIQRSVATISNRYSWQRVADETFSVYGGEAMEYGVPQSTDQQHSNSQKLGTMT